MTNTLNDFITQPLAALKAQHGAFYAFSTTQLEEKSVQGVDYVKLPDGIIVPADNASAFYEAKKEIVKQGMLDRVAKIGKKGVIMHALWNNECALSMTIDAAVYDVELYGFTESDVLEHFAEYHTKYKELND